MNVRARMRPLLYPVIGPNCIRQRQMSLRSAAHLHHLAARDRLADALQDDLLAAGDRYMVKVVGILEHGELEDAGDVRGELGAN
jgi:hypothetical protein